MADKIDATAPVSPAESIEPGAGTQNARLLEWLRRDGSTVDPLISWRLLGIYRLSARVFDLRKAGHNVVAERKTVRNRYGETVSVAEYRLEGK